MPKNGVKVDYFVACDGIGEEISVDSHQIWIQTIEIGLLKVELIKVTRNLGVGERFIYWILYPDEEHQEDMEIGKNKAHVN